MGVFLLLQVGVAPVRGVEMVSGTVPGGSATTPPLTGPSWR